jgi:hypothetical protein
MGNRAWFWIAMAVLGLVALAGISTYSYNLGLAQGLADNGRAIAFAPRPWGFGFGFLPFFPFFFILFWFVVLRALFWRGPWGHRRWYYDGVPPAFDEWHRRAHARQDKPGPAPEADAHA